MGKWEDGDVETAKRKILAKQEKRNYLILPDRLSNTVVRFFSLRDKWGLGVHLSGVLCGGSGDLIIQGE